MITVGIDIGGTKVLGVTLGADGEVLAEERRETAGNGDALVDLVVGVAGGLVGEREVAAVGVGAAGLVDADGFVHYAPNLEAFVQFPLRERLEERLGVPVVVDNDANAAAWGEVVYGAAAGVRDALVITLGTGIGGGIVSGGHLYRGARGFAAEVGHFQVVEGGSRCACGEWGHWEAVASGRALGALGREWARRGDATAVLEAAGGDPEAVEGEHVAAAAREGDTAARQILDEYADRVAVGLAGLANILDPALIVVGGGLVELGDLLLEPLRESFGRRIEAPGYREAIPLVPAKLGERAGAIGAAALAREVAGG